MSQTEKRPKRSFSGLPFYLVLIVILIVASQQEQPLKIPQKIGYVQSVE